MQGIRRKLLSQNFLNNQKLVSRLVASSSIGKKDLVLEIGPGKGIITKELISAAGHVIAVELDNHWYRFLMNTIHDDSLTLYHGDFLSFSLPRLPYKVFANVPFAIEGKIIRKLIEHENPPDDCYLVVMDSLAERLLASHKENMFSIMHKPWFEFSIIHRFKASDFSPVPSVKPVLFRFVKRLNPLLAFNDRSEYRKFVQTAFGNGLAIRKNLRRSFSVTDIDIALHKLSLRKKIKPTELRLEQWVQLFRLLKKVG
ncbi:MAG: hypothetical protein COY80_03195 [Candidatus Pacebacteria bacterium CG_4_10_14_0_8_um_filter_42_14]|nr:MAG: hypothetical protein COY80_03195 [Candidatus Pacebacteria bacterium CG_4_10_14_0_8_um_filter_42_14]